eukprot:TRINITY_DN6911_c0_g1_i1.p1 TRINITY_DN6911_c0_g1~~TRINITY_DN6911_c0_g1_i1.p1  ORF type:complete len:959 (+),score=292.68 TRINITY_DN6911_c0_g1_i1:76-2877(+)
MGNSSASSPAAPGEGCVELAARHGSVPVGLEGVVAFRVLSFCSWRERALLAGLGRDWRALLGLSTTSQDGSRCDGNDMYFYFLCERLAAEHLVYVPLGAGTSAGSGQVVRSAPPKSMGSSWESVFRELFPLHRRGSEAKEDVTPSSPQNEEEVFRINVAARFRPARTAATEAAMEEVVLPLHQKVQLVKQQYGVSSKDAVAMIMRERSEKTQRKSLKKGGRASCFQLPADGEVFSECLVPDTSNKENGSSASNQAPASQGYSEKKPATSQKVLEDETEAEPQDVEEEVTTDARCSILAVREDSASVLAVTRQSGLRDFRFDRVYGEASVQADVYESSAQRLVVDFLNGKCASVICYGQTGSGKTFSMFGPPSTSSAGKDVSFRGIVPRACIEILEAVEGWRAQGVEASVGVSYVEIFGSEVSDLLKEGQVLGQGQQGRYDAVRATDRVGHRYVLDGHNEIRVRTWEEVDDLLRIGDEAKRRAATAMNERSTRAHSLLVLTLCKGSSAEGMPEQRSRFYLADLGGCENVTKSKTDATTQAKVTVVGGEEQSRISWEEYYRNRQRIQETLHINKGLLALKRVIEALHKRSTLSAEGVPQERLPYVPYQDSKLTMILQDALGGSARTLVITTATMEPEHVAESIQTLRFAETCASIQKRSDGDKAFSVQMALHQLAKEIEQVEDQIKKKERWEEQRVMRTDIDTIGGAFGELAKSSNVFLREEVVVKSVLVGAEAERERLEWLLQRQADLEGMGGAGLKHYHDMTATETRDGGRGGDWREKDRFQTKMKARDFEDEGVLADAIRFFFRKAAGAGEAFGETEVSKGKRLTRTKIPAGYFRLARSLRQGWEDASDAGVEKRGFGKTMLDRTQEWRQKIKQSPDMRCTLLQELLHEFQYVPAEADYKPLPAEREVEENILVNASPSPSPSPLTSDLDEF